MKNPKPFVASNELRDLLLDFRRFLIRGWPYRPTSGKDCSGEMSSEEIWINSHWEILVEHPLCRRFGDDFVLDTYEHPGDHEFRVFRPYEFATHTIILNRDWVFTGFWSGKNESELEVPTFHLVIGEPVSEKDWLTEPFDRVEFSLEPVEYVDRE